MRVEAERSHAAGGALLDYESTVRLLETFFGWKPVQPTRILIKALSRFVDPMEQGSYHGRALPGNPHRAGLVTVSPLTVFAIYGASYRRRVLLAARLRYSGEINLIEMEKTGREKDGRRPLRGRLARGRRGRAKSARSLPFIGIEPSSVFTREWVEGARSLDVLLAIQELSELSVRIVPVARASQQLPPEAPPQTIPEKVKKANPWALVRKATALARTTRTGSLKNAPTLPLKVWTEEDHSPEAPATSRDSGVTELRIEMKKRFFSEERACSGPPSDSKSEVRRKVLADPFLRTYMQEYALREGLADDEVLDEAAGFVREIASDYRIGVARWVARFVDIVFDRFVDSLEIDKSGIRFITECDSRTRIVLVCSHKSYIDSLFMGYALLRSGLAPPQQAAGQNLMVWPVGWILRHCGAFYIRRSFAGETLYKEVFKAYVRYLLVGNYVSVLYLEGARSRDGKLARPKLGYMSILADALRKGVCPDITLLPVYLGYDKIPEEGSHVKEMTGGRKEREGIGAFARIWKSVNTSIGRAFVKFGNPVSLRELLAGRELEDAACSLSGEISDLAPVTGRSLAACGLLVPVSSWVVREEALAFAGELHNLARAKGIEQVDDMGDVERALDWFVREGHLLPETVDGTEGFKVDGRARRFLDYNKNIIVQHFAGESIGAVARRAAMSEPGLDPAGVDAWREFLADLLEEEFYFGLDGDHATEQLDVTGEKEDRFLTALIEPQLEGYLAALVALETLRTGELVELKDFVEECFRAGEKLADEGTIHREESLSKVTFKNAARSFGKMGLLSEIRDRDDEGYEKLTIVPAGATEDASLLQEKIRVLLAN